MPVGSISGVAAANIAAVDGISSFASFSGLAASSGAANFSTTYGFDDQSVNTSNSGVGWSPSLTHSSWANGTAATSNAQGYWAAVGTPVNGVPTSAKVSGGWRCDSNATGSSSTGPAGALNVTGSPGTHSTDSTTKYIYAETSGALGNQVMVCRSPGFVFRDLMADTANNNLTLKFWIHAYGSSMGDLYIYVDDAATSAAQDAELYAKFTASHTGTFSAGTTTLTATSEANHSTVSPSTLVYSNNSNSLWIQASVGLNHIRNLNQTSYVYFVYVPGADGSILYRGDLAIDQVEFVEE